MSVDITPHSQLGFPRPLTDLVTRPLTITNTSSSPVNYKVKTTAPNYYFVRPNSGTIAPNATVEVSILIQLPEEPALNAKCRDKFLVQTAPVPGHLAGLSTTEFWTQLNASAKETIKEHKLRVVWLPPKSAAVPEEPEEESNSLPTTMYTHAKLHRTEELQAENAKLRAQVSSKSSSGFGLHVVVLLSSFVAAAVAAGTWYAITNGLIEL